MCSAENCNARRASSGHRGPDDGVPGCRSSALYPRGRGRSPQAVSSGLGNRSPCGRGVPGRQSGDTEGRRDGRESIRHAARSAILPRTVAVHTRPLAADRRGRRSTPEACLLPLWRRHACVRWRGLRVVGSDTRARHARAALASGPVDEQSRRGERPHHVETQW